jgi:hypothetical protein
MRVFVGFGYLDKESWIPELVLPMLAQLGIEIIEGREIAGTPIDQTLRDLIGSCDALIGILTKRAKRRDGQWDTSDYVRQELEIALASNELVVPVVENGVVLPKGFLNQTQFILFERGKRDVMLVDLARHVRDWVAGEVTIRILPDELAAALAPGALDGTAACQYKIIHQNHVIRKARAQIFGDGGSMFTKLVGFKPGTQAQMRIQIGGMDWASRLANHTTPFTQIELKRVP